MAKYRVKQNLIKKLSANNLDDEKLILNISLEQEEKLNLTKEERGALIELRTEKDLFKFFISKDDDKDETEEQKEK